MGDISSRDNKIIRDLSEIYAKATELDDLSRSHADPWYIQDAETKRVREDMIRRLKEISALIDDIIRVHLKNADIAGLIDNIITIRLRDEVLKIVHEEADFTAAEKKANKLVDELKELRTDIEDGLKNFKGIEPNNQTAFAFLKQQNLGFLTNKALSRSKILKGTMTEDLNIDEMLEKSVKSARRILKAVKREM
jgi:hypothetical protein